ncbi:MAG: DNA topoisomerase IV subunit A [Bauldia sp.]|nr:DNA topoisomerase IV subunit A [Bauldia sp.]
MGKELIPPGEGVESVNLRDALEERYLTYALSTITNRALPDVRDGLKPVHRRLLYAMRQLRLDPGSGFKKCARVVGDVIGKFHPHGEQSVYDALVRLAQEFAVRYPLVDGQGNFGNIDGDNAAAMRYTEARLTEVASFLLDGLNENAVDFRPTYDGQEEEPVVLPGAFPNLLANGSSGIAVGMATSIPPHNAAELCEAALHLIKHPKATTEDLMAFVPGPDFPTGGTIVEPRSSILQSYETGRGAIRLRARWKVEDQGRGTYVAAVTELPYGVEKAKLIERIAELLEAKKLHLVADIRDESAEDVRVVIEPKSRTVDAQMMMESLFHLTELETRVSVNMNVLSRGIVPRVMGLKPILREWLDHRREVLRRRSENRLAEIRRRLELLDGFLIAYLNLDEVIRIIREEDEPKQVMIARFGITEVQAEAILNMRLRALRKLEEIEIRKEHASLTEEADQITTLLGSDARQWTTVAWEIKEVQKAVGKDTDLGRRRTDFADAPAHDISDLKTAMIEREPITVVVSEKGWVRALKGHLGDLTTLSFKDGDGLKLAFPAETTDKILAFSTAGRFYTIGADKLPGGRGQGEPIRLMVDMADGEELIAAMVFRPEQKFLLSSTDGRGFVVAASEVEANTKKGKQVLSVDTPAEAKLCVPASGDMVATIGQNRKMLIFPIGQVPEMPRGKGVRLQRFKDGGIADARVFDGKAGLSWTDSSGRVFVRSLDELKEWLGERAQAGRLPPQGFPRSNSFGR